MTHRHPIWVYKVCEDGVRARPPGQGGKCVEQQNPVWVSRGHTPMHSRFSSMEKYEDYYETLCQYQVPLSAK